MSPRPKIGEILVQAGHIGPAEVERALDAQRQTGGLIGRIMVDLGMISEDALAAALAQQFGLEVWKFAPEDPPTGVQDRLPDNFMKSNAVLPVAASDGTVTVAVASPQDYTLLETIRSALSERVEFAVATAKDILAGIEAVLEPLQTEEAEDETGARMAGDVATDVEHLRDLASEAPVIRWVNDMLTEGVAVQASDIHLECFERKTARRYRIDGVLRDFPAPPPHLYEAIVSRIKVMAKLDIAERRAAQDGRIQIKLGGRQIDLRISIIPTLHGEDVVIRILDTASVLPELKALGHEDDIVAKFQQLIHRPHGMILLTGPTGSGKSTTLYAALREVLSPELKIMSIEDPVEYGIGGVCQIQVVPQKNLTFALGLRSILRHDPDVIMVGEIRDSETADIAVQAALTGHLVLSTLHTNDAPSAFPRLLDMGIDDYLIASCLACVVAQRLVRRLCPHCTEPDSQPPEVLEWLGLEPGTETFRGRGCDHCYHTGYRGRTAIGELLITDSAVRALVLDHSDADQIRNHAIAHGMRTLLQDATRKVIAHKTSVDEVIRVCGAEQPPPELAAAAE